MKALKIIGILVVVLIIALFAVILNLGKIVKTGINTVVPQVTKCEAHVDDVNFNVFGGKFEIKNLVIKNPEGYKTDHAFALGHIFVNVNMGSLMSDVIEIDQVLIDAPEITYEVGLGNSNLNTILENVNSSLPSSDEDSAKIAGGMEAPIVLPDIEIKDLGKKEGGISMVQAAAITLKTTLLSIFDVLKSSGKLLLDGAKAIGEGIVDGVKSLGDGAKDSIKSLGDSAKEGVKSLEDGAKSLGDSAKDIKDNVKDNVKNAAEGLKNLIPGKK